MNQTIYDGGILPLPGRNPQAMIRTKSCLFLTLFWVTLIFTVLPPLGVSLSGLQITYSKFVYLIGIIGVAHVGMTAFFFIGDRRYSAIISDNPARYIGAPILLVGGAFAIFMYWPQGIWPYFAAHYAWLLWHFGRQNFGIYAFLAGSNRSGPVGKIERAYFSLLPIAAIPRALIVYPQIGLTAGWATVATVATFIMASACVALAIAAWPSIRHDRQRVIAIALGFLFFLPTMISTNPLVATAFYAHPVQYVVMMTYLAADQKQGSVLWRILALVAVGLGLWVVLTYLSGSFALAFLALTYGITQAHFVIDAGLWKMKQPKQRAAILESYDFLFSAPKQG